MPPKRSKNTNTNNKAHWVIKFINTPGGTWSFVLSFSGLTFYAGVWVQEVRGGYIIDDYRDDIEEARSLKKECESLKMGSSISFERERLSYDRKIATLEDSLKNEKNK